MWNSDVLSEMMGTIWIYFLKFFSETLFINCLYIHGQEITDGLD